MVLVINMRESAVADRPGKTAGKQKNLRIHLLRRFAAITVIFAILLLAGGAGGYAAIFSGRVTTPEAQRFDASTFSTLCAETVLFPNCNGDQLAGQLYSFPGKEPVGLLVVVHGMGYGHRAYLNVIDFFTREGFLVFSYDATGYDDSEGSSAKGVPQMLLDLDAALNTAEALPEAAGLSVCLFGHSMGAYAACAVLTEHPEVRAVAALAGFDSTAAWIRERFGFFGLLLTPGAALWEKICFGSAAGRTSMQGFAASNARFLIAHSSDDPEVPIGCGLDRYAETCGSDPRFLFLRLEGSGHGGLFTAEIQAACLDLFRRACEH